MAGSQIIKRNRPYSFDIDTVMSMSKEDLEHYLQDNELEVARLLDESVEMMRKIRALEQEIEGHKEAIARLEAIKIEQKAAIPVWKSIAVAAAALGALVMSIFMGNDEENHRP